MKSKIGKVLGIVILLAIWNDVYGITVTEDFSSSKKIDTANTTAVLNTNLKRTTLSITSDLIFEDISSQVVGFSTDTVLSVGYNGSYWLVGGKNGKLNKYDGTTWTDLTSSIPFGGGGAGVNAIAWNGSYWLIGGSSASVTELHKYDGTTFTELSAALKIALGNQDMATYSIKWNGTYWLIGGGTAFLVKYDGTTFTNLSSGLIGFATNDILDALGWNGSYWLIGANVGVPTINRYDGTTFTNLSSSYLGAGIISMTEWNGTYWLVGGGIWENTPFLNKYDGTTWTSLTSSVPSVGSHKLYYSTWNSDYGYWLIGVDLSAGILRYDGNSFSNISSLLRNVSSNLSVKSIWGGDTWFIYGDGSSRSLNKGQHLYTTNNVLQSQKLNDISENIASATLTASGTLNGGSISYELSADGGTHWESVQAGSSHTFKYPGKDLRYKATMTPPTNRKLTPILTQLSINYKTESKKIKAGEKGEVLSNDDIETKILIPEGAISKTLVYNIEKTIIPSAGTSGTKDIVLSYNFEAKEPDTNKVISNLEGVIEIIIHYRSSDGIRIYDTNGKELIKLSEAKEKLGIGFYNGRYWVPVSSEVNVSGNDVYVKGKTSHLTEYGILVKPGVDVTFNASPNPFTPKSSNSLFNQVTFTFSNKDGETVEVLIWDITGRLIRKITGYGTSSISWDGKDEYSEFVEGGVYIYQIKVGNNKAGRGTVVVAY